MNKTSFDNALCKVIEQDYSIFREAPQHSFSSRFEKQMEDLFQKQKRPFWRFTSTPGRRLVFVILTLFLFFTCLLSISADARESVIHMIRNIGKGHVDYEFDSPDSKPIDKFIRFSQLPEGLVETNVYRSEWQVRYTYQDRNNNTIILEQRVNNGQGPTIDTDFHELKQYNIEGMAVDLYICSADDLRYASSFAIWSLDRYIIQLDITGSIPEEQILSWISLIKLEE